MASSDPTKILDAQLLSTARPDTSPSTTSDVETSDVGVWRVLTERRKYGNITPALLDYLPALGPLNRFFLDIYKIDSELVQLFYFYKFLAVAENNLLLYCTTQFFNAITTRTSPMALISVLIFRIIVMSLATLIRTKRNQLSIKLEACIRDYFDLALFKSRLEDGILSNAQRLESTEIWQAFSGISDIAFEFCQMITQILYMATLSHTRDPTLLIICALRPLVSLLYMERDYWSRPILAYIDNNDYFRKTALDRLTGPAFIDEIITSNSAAYFIRQYEECIKKLNGIPLRRFYESQGMNQTIWAVIIEFLSELRMVYAVFSVVRNRAVTPTISSVAIVERSGYYLSNTFDSLIHDFQDLSRQLNIIHRLYEPPMKTSVSTGLIPYQDSPIFNKGMQIEFSNVNFSWGKTTNLTLKDLSFVIKPGQLVVIVGPNGCGKSTAMKLIERFHEFSFEPSKGQVLINGISAQALEPTSVRNRIVCISQNHTLVPACIRENVGMGYGDHIEHEAMIFEAVKEAGVQPCIKKHGLDNIILHDRQPTAWNLDQINGEKTRDYLNQRYVELLNPIHLSGGEEQRIAAARMFMGLLNKPDVKLAIFDEPTSALDPAAERAILENIIKYREGKTMIFVTHRLGFITQTADVILCMKDGGITECGSHEELMKLGREYSILYNAQAKGFLTHYI